MKKNKFVPTVLGLTMLMSFNAYAGADGWKQENNKWKYYKEDKALKAWQQINNKWYFFNEDGNLKTGWHLDASNNWYFLDSSKTVNEGVLLSGWQWIDGYCYYFEGTDKASYGKMYANTAVEGYRVDTAGRWINETGMAYYEVGKGISTGNSSQGSSNTAKKTSVSSSSGKGEGSGGSSRSGSLGKSGGSSRGGSSGKSGGSSSGKSSDKSGGSSSVVSSDKSSGSSIGENTGRSDGLSGLNQGEKREENKILRESKGAVENSSSKKSEDFVGSRQDLSIEKNTNKEDTKKSSDNPAKPATSSNVEIPKEDGKKDTEPKESKKPEAESKESAQNRAEKIKESLITSENDNVVQYTNEDGEIRTIIWVKGINGPVMREGGDFHKEITQGGKNTYVMYTVPYSSGDGWYDVNKTRSGGNIDIDKNLCFAAV